MRHLWKIDGKNILAALLALPLAAPAVAAGSSGSRVAEQVARPALAALAASTAELTGAVEALCATPDGDRLAAARAAFGAVTGDWGRVSVLRFGPLATGNRFERLFFWPDPRGLGLKQVQRVLAARDETATTQAGLSQKSVAAQGLPALEFILFGTGAQELAAGGEPFRCRYAQAAAGNIARVVSLVADGWKERTDFAVSFTSPAADTEPYRSASEVDGEIVKAAGTVIQYVRAAELIPALGDSADAANGKRTPLWRSGLSFRLMEAQVSGMRALLAAAAYGEIPRTEVGQAVAALDDALAAAQAPLGQIRTPPEAAFADEADRARIAAVNSALDRAGHLLSEELAPALGLTMGFNALDGD